MKPISKITITIIVTALLFSGTAHAKRKRSYPSAKPDEVVTFTQSKTLPGPIHVEFSLVTLARYRKDVDKVFDYTFSETTRIAELFNSANPSSDLAKISNAAGQSPVEVGKEALIIAEHAKEISEWTRGAFDPVRGSGTYKNLKVNKKKKTVYLSKAGSSLDLRGILDGFIADLFIRAAFHANLDDSFVSANGVSRAMGHASYGPWRIVVGGGTGNGKKADHGMSITISNYSAATVGAGSPISLIDPRTRKPANPPFTSVTVLCQQAATAQGVATALYFANLNEGEAIIKGLGVRALYSYPDGKITKVGKW